MANKVFKIRSFRATDNVQASMSYAEGHRDVLKSYGVDQIVAPDNSWMEDPNVYVIIVEDLESKYVFGGAKIQVCTKGIDLPLQKALREKDNRIDDLVEYRRINGGTAEFCGLWNSRKVAGWGVGSIFLGIAGVARVGAVISTKLDIGSMFVLAASYTLPLALRVGFVRETEVGNNGSFEYPTDEFKAYLAALKDPKTLSSAMENEKNHIISLRENPSQIILEEGPKGKAEIHYDLRF